MKNYKTNIAAACLAGAIAAASCAADSEPPQVDGLADEGNIPGPISGPTGDGRRSVTAVLDIDPEIDPEVDPEPNIDPEVNPEPETSDLIEEEDLSAEEQERIAILRDSIDEGLRLGRILYVDEINTVLQNIGIFTDYDLNLEGPETGLYNEVSLCPFVEFYENGFDAGTNCDYLADQAKVEVYAELGEIVPLSEELAGSAWGEEAIFWYEQGVISAFEEYRTHVRYDLERRGLCNAHPTPIESSYAKGVTIGRQHFAAAFNLELERRGFEPDYPAITINICNAGEAFVEPALSNAIGTLGMAMEAEPLCAFDYSPPDREASLQYSQAMIDYERGVRAGIEEEFSLASVNVFRQVRCNVGDPLVIDVDGDGLELSSINNGVDFDLYNTGRLQALAWPVGGDGFLAYDWNGDGAITSGAELFGNVQGEWTDGFHHLASFDLDMDNFITKNDKIFSGLVVWQDFNEDGQSTQNEISPLWSFGVSAVPTIGESSQNIVNGNSILFTAWTEGEALLIGDANLAIAPWPRLARLD